MTAHAQSDQILFREVTQDFASFFPVCTLDEVLTTVIHPMLVIISLLLNGQGKCDAQILALALSGPALHACSSGTNFKHSFIHSFILPSSVYQESWAALSAIRASTSLPIHMPGVAGICGGGQPEACEEVS